MDYRTAKAELERMERGLADTRRNLALIEHALRKRAEVTTMRVRPKQRQYGRHAVTWTGADEREYRRILGELMDRAAAEIDRLRRRTERQEAAIMSLRSKYGVNAERPNLRDW